MSRVVLRRFVKAGVWLHGARQGREVDEKGFYHAASFATQFRVGALAPLGFVESSPNLQALLIPLLSMCVQNMSSKNAKLEISQKSRVSEHVAGATRFCKM